MFLYIAVFPIFFEKLFLKEKEKMKVEEMGPTDQSY